ncbi:MAG: AEC family transporter [Eubacterium sp.]|nr:AEC family transporter [Eubacterium sp.]
MSFFIVFEKMIELFLMIALGFIAGKIGFMTKEKRTILSSFVLKITLPCMIIASVINADSLPDAGEFFFLLGVTVLAYATMFGLGFLLVKLLRFKPSVSGTAVFILMFPNIAFMGFPVLSSIWGNEGLFYGMMYSIPFNMLCETLGVSLILHDKRHKQIEAAEKPGSITAAASGAIRAAAAAQAAGTAQAAAQGAVPDKEDTVVQAAENVVSDSRSRLKKVLLSPIIITSFAAIVLALIKIQVPDVISNPITLLGNITTPASMIVIGASLAAMPFKEMFGDPKIYVLSAIKLLLVPIVIFLIFRLFLDNPVFLGVSTVITSMPVAAMGQMYSIEYQGNERMMARAIFLTTACAVVTIPLMTMLVG